MHVERSVQELVLQVREATRQLTQQLGHMPADAEVASHLGISDGDLREARRADLAFQPASLDAPLAGQPYASSLADVLGEEDPQVEHTLDMESVAAHWDELPRREQKILLMRFYGDMTQAEIGQQLGISQMHVSRLLSHALGRPQAGRGQVVTALSSGRADRDHVTRWRGIRPEGLRLRSRLAGIRS